MKTIFRYANVMFLVAAIMTLGIVTAYAQNPCEDADGIAKLDAQFREQLPVKTVDGRKATIATGKSFLEKYGACDSTKEFSDYLKVQVPKMEKALADMLALDEKKKLLDRFDASMKAKNWDDVFASGKEILGKYPDEFRAVELVLGSVGYDESTDRANTKYNAETLKFAKQSLADLDAGKEFKPSFGLAPFTYKDKADAIAWMNLTIGYFLQTDAKDKASAAPYLYKATQAGSSDTSKNATPYAFIGAYYFDQLNDLVKEIKTAEATQNTTDTPEVAQKKVDDIKALVAKANGTSERAMDAFSRAFTLSKAPAFKATMKKNVEDAYQLRFGKKEGVDAWIAGVTAKPFPNPSSPIEPISDPEPAKTTGDAAAGTATGTGVGGAKPAATTTKPATTTTTPAKPAGPIKPGGSAKPSMAVKKAVTKKRVG